MKKNALLIILSAFALCGCDFLSFESQNKETEQNTKENENPGTENGGTNSGSSESGGQQNQPQELNKEEYTATILTSGSNFESQFSVGTNFDDTKVTSLTNFFAAQLLYTNLVNELTCTKLVSAAYDNIAYMQFGSQKGVGALAITSGVKIYKVAVKVSCFAKYNDYQKQWNIDNEAHFYINQQDNDLSYDGATPPSFVSFEQTFEDGIDTVNLASYNGRVFLKEMTITWRA